MVWHPTTRLLLWILLAVAVCGCVRRRLYVNSNPPGALVYVDNEQIGTTPCAVDFTYYGTREIRLVKPGYETLTVNQPIPTPWYQFPPLDFVSENLVPYKIRDNRSVVFNLAPEVIVPSQELIARGNELRAQTQVGPVLPAAATTAPAFTVPAGAPVAPPVLTPPFGPPPVVLPPPPQPLPNVPSPAPIGTPFPPGPVAPQVGPPLVSPSPN